MKQLISQKDLQKASEMAQCARIAYMDGAEAKEAYKELGFKSHKFFDIDGAQCHAVWNKEQYVLCLEEQNHPRFQMFLQT